VFRSIYRLLHFIFSFTLSIRSGAGAPVVGECEGDYRHDSRKNILDWRLPVIDASNKSGSMEFTVTGHTNDFFPVTVNFVSKKSFCDIEVSEFVTAQDCCCYNAIMLGVVLRRSQYEFLPVQVICSC